MSTMTRVLPVLLLQFCLLPQAFAAQAVDPAAQNTHPRQSTQVPVAPDGPYDRVFHAENLPSAANAAAFPKAWTHFALNPQHNNAFTASGSTPDWLAKGVSWNFAEARAWPLSQVDAFDTEVIGAKTALPTQTQFYGNAVGVSVVNGIVYAESDDQFAYAVNARTGKLIWRNSPVGNTLMGSPLVADGMVYLSAGGVGFNFSNVQAFAKTGEAARGKGVSFNGIYALNARDGKLKWHFGTIGEAMPTPAYDKGHIFFTTGNGNAIALDARTGKQIWRTHLRGMANMSSPVVMNGRIFVALSSPGHIFSLDEAAGRVLWKGSIQGASDTGMGDVPPAADGNIVVMDAVADTRQENGKSTMDTRVVAFDAAQGRVLWSANMGRGPKPPAFKGGVPMIHDGVVYVGTPVNSVYQAYDLHSGKLLWTWKIPDPGPAGAGRGAPTFYQGRLYVATGPNIYALDPKTGTLLSKLHVGGRFGISSPVIIGGTMFLSNSWDWLHAIPLSRLQPASAAAGHGHG